MNRVLTGAVLLLLIFGVGCKNKDSVSANQDDINAAIQRHLGDAGVKVDAMTQETKNITVKGDQATAEVDFRVKNGDQNIKMSFEYALQRKDGQWNVVKSESVGGGPHNDTSATPGQ